MDLATVVVGFGRALHDAGIPVTPERSERFARALALDGAADLYWMARAVFVSSHEQIPTFDAVFRGLVTGVADPADSRGDSTAPPAVHAIDPATAAGQPSAAAPGGGMLTAFADGGAVGESDGREGVLAAASADERLAAKSFADLDPDELAQVRRMMRRLALATPVRRSRRLRRGHRGEHLDLRTTIRRSLRTGGDPVDHARRRRRPRRRRLVLILDVSGSMEPYSRAFLQFLQSAVGGASAEAFVFATRLTRLTRLLGREGSERALKRAAAAAPDWSGGTRIGAALAEFNDRHGRRGVARGAVVVILSDGWEAGDPELVAREMERLARLAHRIVWINPRSAAPGFAPLTGGMTAALPHCDVVLSGHTLAALDAVVDEIARDV
jgi:uncharacterized protein with von Willebrand factor type A (vWA) domain